MDKINLIKDVFSSIKQRGFVKSTRPNNVDGGIGNTLEDLMGITENNLNEADFNGVEIKSHRFLNTSKISLFTKAPDFPKKANSILREKYGEIREDNQKKLYASIFGNRYSLIYEKFYMKLTVNKEEERIYLEVKNGEHILREIYWEFRSILKYSQKIKDLLLVSADHKAINGEIYFSYQSAILYYNFSFDRFIDAIENGKIQFDIRIGYYKSGKNIGKVHDHGSGFRISSSDFALLYNDSIDL